MAYSAPTSHSRSARRSSMVKSRPSKKAGFCDLCGGKLLVRKDDTPEAVQERLRIYHAEADGLVQFYRRLGIVNDLSVDRPIEEVTPEVLRILEKARPSSE